MKSTKSQKSAEEKSSSALTTPARGRPKTPTEKRCSLNTTQSSVPPTNSQVKTPTMRNSIAKIQEPAIMKPQI